MSETVKARELLRGDRIHQTRENGKSSGGGATVLRIYSGPETTIVQVWTGEHEYRNDDTVTIDRRDRP